MPQSVAKDELFLSEQQHAITAQLGLAALSTVRLRDFQKIISGKLIASLQADAVVIGRLKDAQHLELFASQSCVFLQRPVELLSGSDYEMSPEAIVIATDQPVLIESFDNQDEFEKPGFMKPEIVKEMNSAMVVPLKGYTGMLGTISVYNKKPHSFDASDVHFLQSVASILSLAIERRQAQLALQQSREKLDVILHSIGDGVYAQGPHGQILYANQAALNVSGYAFPQGIQEELSETDRVVLLTESLNQLTFRDQQGNGLGMKDLPGEKAFQTGQPQTATVQFADPQRRSNKWVLIKANPVVNHQQAVEYVVNVLTDITEFKKTERQLELYKERFELAQRSGSVGIFEWDLQQDLVWWSSGEEALFQIPRGSFGDEFKERDSLAYWQDRVHPMDRNRIREKIADAIENNQRDYENEFRIINANGETRWLKSIARISYDAQGKPVRIVGLNYDITDRIVKEQRKDEFISMASHELKTPLTSVKAFNQMMLKKLEKGEVNTTQFKQYLKRTEAQINRLNKLVSDLLDVTKIQQGKLQLDKVRVNLNDVLQELIGTFRQTHTSHRFILELDEEIEVFVDQHRIEQVFINLLTNAVKYSKDGSDIIIRLERQKKKAVVSVQDFGIGIAKKHFSDITKRFYRVEKGDEAKYPGLGIGLYIARQVVEQHDGQLKFKSKPGEGSTFSVSLPTYGV